MYFCFSLVIMEVDVENTVCYKSFKVERFLQDAKLNCNLLENICGWTVVLYGQTLLHRLFHWKSFTATN